MDAISPLRGSVLRAILHTLVINRQKVPHDNDNANRRARRAWHHQRSTGYQSALERSRAYPQAPAEEHQEHCLTRRAMGSSSVQPDVLILLNCEQY